jgi:hypothetical protein
MIDVEKKRARNREYSRAWGARNREKQRESVRTSRMRTLLAKFNPSRPMPEHCELCGCAQTDRRKKELCLDHAHGTTLFRGWLCSNCNAGIGLLKDNPVLLERAADYVRFGGL